MKPWRKTYCRFLHWWDQWRTPGPRYWLKMEQIYLPFTQSFYHYWVVAKREDIAETRLEHCPVQVFRDYAEGPSIPIYATDLAAAAEAMAILGDRASVGFGG